MTTWFMPALRQKSWARCVSTQDLSSSYKKLLAGIEAEEIPLETFVGFKTRELLPSFLLRKL
jgi:hypothetical protein